MDSPEAQSARGAIWLTPNSVKEFSKKDFPELPEEDRNLLEEHINRFREIAHGIPRGEDPQTDQIQEAVVCFLKIADLLECYLPVEGEFQQVRNIFEKIEFPESVFTWNFELRNDSTDYPSVWIWLFVDPEEAKKDTFQAVTDEIIEKIRSELPKAGVTRWPYIRFRTASEQRELVA